MGIQYILSKKPNKSSMFVFGSALRKSSPKDVDILIVYDKNECPPSEAYAQHKELLNALELAFFVPVDMTFLTIEEEVGVGFIESVGAIEFEQAYKKLTIRSRRTRLT